MTSEATPGLSRVSLWVSCSCLLLLLCLPRLPWASERVSLLGAWRLDDGRVLTLAPSADDSWRYRFMQDGRSGRLHRRGESWIAGPGFADQQPVALEVLVQSADRLSWRETGTAAQRAVRIKVSEQDLGFESEDVRLSGRLVLPATAGPHPVVVLIHGSERLPAVGQWHDPYMLAAHGIGAFVYDKRGTGRSGGSFTADFRQLADDAAAAARVVKQQDRVDSQRIGFAGFSQGGWVAPLAAQAFGQTRAVLVAYGAIGSPLQEDRWQCQRALAAVADDARAAIELERLVDATHDLLLRDLRGDWSQFKRAAQVARKSGWLKQLRSEQCIAAGFARYPAWVLRMFARKRLPPGLDWDYDSTAVLQRSTLPMLWLLAEKDSEAPTEMTAASLAELSAAGQPYEVQILAGAEHGMLLYREEGGERIDTGYHPEYFKRTLEFWRARFALH